MKKWQVQVARGATERQRKFGYKSLMFVTLVSWWQWSRQANKMQEIYLGDDPLDKLPTQVFNSVEEAQQACEDLWLDLTYAIYVY